MAGWRQLPWALLAAAWAIAFAALSFYWSAGGTVGADTLARTLEADIREGNDVFALGVVPGIVKLGLASLALALARPDWFAGHRRLVRGLGWLAGGALALYGLASTVEKALMEVDAIDVPAALDGRAGWYLFLWDPIWLLGGILFLLATAAAKANEAASSRARLAARAGSSVGRAADS